MTRRKALQAGLVSGAAIAYGLRRRPAIATAATDESARSAGEYPFNQEWLFGGVYVSGAEASSYSESGFQKVRLPHTVTPLSWGDWDHTAWEKVWIYRRHINQAAVGSGRVFVDFQGA
ncbi:MAG TPA: hypothetical protein VGG87_00845, partial [Solirubrobacteraceae bacterium]